MGEGIRANGGLILYEIEVKGFVSYLDLTTLELHGGAVAITGKNGSGKSSIVSKALTWCLYGKCAPERMGSSAQSLKGNDLINDDAKEASVSICLRSGADQYLIQRIRKRGKRDQATVTVNHAASTMEPEDVVGVPFEVFVRTVVRGQNDPWNFAEATDAKKREIVDVISGAIQLQTAFKAAGDRVKKLKQEQAEVQSALAVSLRHRDSLPDAEAIKAISDQWDQAQADQKSALSAHAVMLNTQWLRAHADAEAAVAAQAALGPEPTLDMIEYESACHKAGGASHEAATALGRAIHAGAMYGRIQPGSACPVCEQIIPESGAIAKKKRKAEKNQAKATKASDEASQWARHCGQLEEKARTWLVEERKKWAAARVPVTSNAGLLKTQLDQAHKQLDDLDAQVNPHRMTIDRDDGVRRKVETEIAHNEEAERMLYYSIRIGQQWVTVLSPKGARAHLADSALQAIETEANRWLIVLSGGRMMVTLTSTKTTVKGDRREEIVTQVLVTRPTGKTVPRTLLQLSGGERARINLAIDLGVAAVFGGGGSLALSFIVLDEAVFSGLDIDGKAAVVEALNAAGVHDVVVIDHDPHLIEALPRTIVVELNSKGHSTLREL